MLTCLWVLCHACSHILKILGKKIRYALNFSDSVLHWIIRTSRTGYSTSSREVPQHCTLRGVSILEFQSAAQWVTRASPASQKGKCCWNHTRSWYGLWIDSFLLSGRHKPNQVFKSWYNFAIIFFFKLIDVFF